MHTPQFGFSKFGQFGKIFSLNKSKKAAVKIVHTVLLLNRGVIGGVLDRRRFLEETFIRGDVFGEGGGGCTEHFTVVYILCYGSGSESASELPPVSRFP